MSLKNRVSSVVGTAYHAQGSTFNSQYKKKREENGEKMCLLPLTNEYSAFSVSTLQGPLCPSYLKAN